jgi:transcriptional regulator with XRE-family HTH domain
MSIGQRIKQVRGDLSKTEFSKRIGISQASLSNYETKNKTPKGDVIQRICKEFGVDLQWLLTGQESPDFTLSMDRKIKVSSGTELSTGKDQGGAVAESEGEYATNAFKVSEALTMAVKVLESNTSYATALYLTIQHFYRAVQSEERFVNLLDDKKKQDKKLKNLENNSGKLKKRIDRLENKLRKQNPKKNKSQD